MVDHMPNFEIQVSTIFRHIDIVIPLQRTHFQLSSFPIVRIGNEEGLVGQRGAGLPPKPPNGPHGPRITCFSEMEYISPEK